MTNRIALSLALLILGAFAIDALAFGGTLPRHLLLAAIRAIDWIEFWR